MQLVERHIIVGSSVLTETCGKAKNIYNQVLYYLRQSLFGNIQKFGEYELSNLMCEFDEENYRLLPSTCSQQVIRSVFHVWSSYFKALKLWKVNPSKFKGKPNLPKYKKEQFVLTFTESRIRVKNGEIYFIKNIIPPIKTKVTGKIKQVRVIPQSTCHVIEVVYEKEITDLTLNKKNILSLDLGLNNLVTGTTNVGLRPFLVNGRILKSFNQWYNKKKAKLQSFIGNRGNSNRVSSLTHYRNCFIEDKMHKTSRFILDYCIENNIGTIIIGKNKNWKSEINLGTKNNQRFTEVPHAKLISKIEYKAKLVGITVQLTEESYTSKIDHLAFEPLQKQDNYLGKRVKRGLFQSSTSKLINSDVNGSIGIMRKVIGNSCINEIANSRNAFLPYRVNIL